MGDGRTSRSGVGSHSPDWAKAFRALAARNEDPSRVVRQLIACLPLGDERSGNLDAAVDALQSLGRYARNGNQAALSHLEKLVFGGELEHPNRNIRFAVREGLKEAGPAITSWLDRLAEFSNHLEESQGAELVDTLAELGLPGRKALAKVIVSQAKKDSHSKRLNSLLAVLGSELKQESARSSYIPQSSRYGSTPYGTTYGAYGASPYSYHPPQESPPTFDTSFLRPEFPTASRRLISPNSRNAASVAAKLVLTWKEVDPRR